MADIIFEHNIKEISILHNKRETKLIDTLGTPWNVPYNFPILIKGEHKLHAAIDEISLIFKDAVTCKLIESGSYVTCEEADQRK